MLIFLFWGAALVLWLAAEIVVRYLGSGPTVIYCLVVSFCCVAAALYAMRERVRLLYGLLELAIGIFILLGAVNNYTAVMGREYTPIIGGGVFHRPPEGWLQWNATWAAMLPIAAAIYILVRGLDNVGEGLRIIPNPRLVGWWRRFFSGGGLDDKQAGAATSSAKNEETRSHGD